MNSDSTTPSNSVRTARRVRCGCPEMRLMEKASSGCISGATSIAPIMTAALFSSSPSDASTADTRISTA